MEGAFVRNITNRSMPIPSPAVGGNPTPNYIITIEMHSSRSFSLSSDCRLNLLTGRQDHSILKTHSHTLYHLNNSNRSVTSGLPSFAWQGAIPLPDIRHISWVFQHIFDLRLKQFKLQFSYPRPLRTLLQHLPTSDAKNLHRRFYFPQSWCVCKLHTHGYLPSTLANTPILIYNLATAGDRMNQLAKQLVSHFDKIAVIRVSLIAFKHRKFRLCRVDNPHF